jgi:hypothetical protein
MAWPLMFWMVATRIWRGIAAHAHGHGHGHGREEVRGVVFLVDHLVADQRPAGRLVERHVQALLAIEAQRVGHDQRRRAGDGDEADLEVLLFQRAILFLRHGLQRTQRQHAGNGRPRRIAAHRPQEVAALGHAREERTHHGFFHHVVGQGFHIAAALLALLLGQPSASCCCWLPWRPQEQPCPARSAS